MERTMEVQGYQIDLDGGRHVFAAERDDDFVIQFRNAEGQLTHLRLSKDAADALRHLLGLGRSTEDTVMRFVLHAAMKSGESKPEYVWTEVGRDTAPSPRS
jgi:hypothetical protein